MSEEKSTAVPAENFKEFVDTHIKATTKFNSADDLLTRAKPLRFIWICLGVSMLVGLIAIFPVGAILGLIVGYIAAFIIGLVKRIKISGKPHAFSGDIDPDDLATFLNTSLSYLPPYFGEWASLHDKVIEKSGILASVANEVIKDEVTVKSIGCIIHGNKNSIKIKFTFYNDSEPRYEILAQKIKSKLLKVVEVLGDNDNTNAGFGEYKCLYNSIPILSAAIEYYIKTKSEEL